MSAFLGITREPVFSPGKVEADRAILCAVADVLRRRGHAVRVVDGDGDLPSPTTRETVFAMCQGDASLETLRAWERDGVRVINSVDSILGCHRHRMLDALRRADVPVPEAVLLRTDDAVSPPWPAWLDSAGGWLKRGDVHATAADDVLLVRGAVAASAALARFRARGIARAVLQRNVDGIVVKLYAVGDELIAWFPPPDVRLALAPAQVEALGATARAAARAVGLDVYGGDCVLDAAGDLFLIDLNDWPSYSACRAAAAESIARHLEARSESIDA